MKVLEVTVESNIDSDSTGKFIAVRESEIYEVHYASPWGATGNKKGAGLFAIPSPQQKVLIIQPDESSTWYLLSVLHSGPFVGESKVPKELYEKRDVPQQFVIRDPIGNELIFSHAYKKSFNYKVQLKSSLGKKLVFLDSPTSSEVRLENEKGDGILIRGKTAPQFAAFPPPPAARSIDIKSSGPMSLISRRSSLNLTIEDGKDLNIRNRSIGFNSLMSRFASDMSTFRTPLFVPYGNVNIESEWRDVNITAGKTHGFLSKILSPFGIYDNQNLLYKENYRGKVMIKARGSAPTLPFEQGAIVQISSDGSIILKSLTGKIYIKGDVLNLRGDSEVNIESRGNVNIQAGEVFKATAGTNYPTNPEPFFPGVGLLSRPLGNSPDFVINTYEEILHNTTRAAVSPIPKNPFSCQLDMGGPLGNTIIDGRAVFVNEQVPRPIYSSSTRLPLPEARKAETPPVILTDYEKSIVPS